MYRSWADVNRALIRKDGRPTARKKLAGNTYLERRDDGTVAVRFHATDIVVFDPGGMSLFTDGWRTSTTKERINRFVPGTVYSDRALKRELAHLSETTRRHMGARPSIWFYQRPDARGRANWKQARVPFEDGMRIVWNPLVEAIREALPELRQRP